jgi:hypothetical protein
MVMPCARHQDVSCTIIAVALTIILPDEFAEEVSREGEVATTSHVRPAGKDGVSAL